MSAVEEWRPVVGYEDRYEVSNMGNVRRLFSTNNRKKYGLLKCSPNAEGYPKVWLFPGGGSPANQYSVHRLVLEAFSGPRPNGQQARHLNGKPGDNRKENLCWGTYKENSADRIRHGTSKCRASVDTTFAKLTREQVIEIRLSYTGRYGEISRFAERFGVKPLCISRAIKGKTYRDVAPKQALVTTVENSRQRGTP